MRRTLSLLLFLSAACSSGGIEFQDVVSIPAGDKEGTALSGTFSIFLEVTSDGCGSISALEIPPKGTTTPLDIEVTQEEGAISFSSIDEIALRGGIDFDNRFELGGGAVVSRDGDDNILRLIHLTGEFEDPDNLTGKGEERLTGTIVEETVDCTFSFSITGARKTS